MQSNDSNVYEEVENAIRETPSCAKWDRVMQLNINDSRSSFWRCYKERLNGAPTLQYQKRGYHSGTECNSKVVCLEDSVWKAISYQMLQTFNNIFDVEAVDLNDKICASKKVDEIVRLYRLGIDDDVLLRNSILIDVNCHPLTAKLSEKIGEVGKCCVTDSLRSKSNTMALRDICGKRTDLGGTTDWIMKRYGATRREAGMYLNLMWWAAWYSILSCGQHDPKLTIDSVIGTCSGGIYETLSSLDGDRLTHPIENTALANASKESAEKTLSTAGRVRLGFETFMPSRIKYASNYDKIYKEISNTTTLEDITPRAYLISRYVDGMFTSMGEALFASEFGESYNSMNGCLCCIDMVQAFDSSLHYNDLSDAIGDMKHKETHNYVICAKLKTNYTFSDHADALTVALTTFDKQCSNNNICTKNRMRRYRYGGAVYIALWPRYRACERGRRYVGTLNNEERNKLIVKGRMCLQGEVYIKDNEWLDGVCSSYDNRREELRKRGYAQSLLEALGVEDDQVAKDYIHSAVKAIGNRPFDTGLELVMSLGSVWLAKLALQTTETSTSYHDFVAELSDWLTTLSLSSMPVIFDNPITPCETMCGALILRLTEILTAVAQIDNIASEAILKTVSAVMLMVSLDPYRCIAHHADMLLLLN